MIKLKKVYVITPIYITYTQELTDKEYKSEIKAVKKEIQEGAREWAYSTTLKEGKSIVVDNCGWLK